MSCNRCNGTGRTHHRYEGGICFKCDGSGREGGDSWEPQYARTTCRYCGATIIHYDSTAGVDHEHGVCIPDEEYERRFGVAR